MITSHSSVSPSATVMSSASAGSLVSAILGCQAHFGTEVRSRLVCRGLRNGLGVLSWTRLGNPNNFWISKSPLFKAHEADLVNRLGRPLRVLDETRAGESAEQKEERTSRDTSVEGNGAASKEAYPTGDLEFEEPGMWDSFVRKCRMVIALPWQRLKKGSVLKLKLSGSNALKCGKSPFTWEIKAAQELRSFGSLSAMDGKVTEQVKGRFSPGLSLPLICQNLIKAAHDPRIEGILIRFEPLDCGWGKIDEICRHIDYFKKSGKFLVGFLVVAGEKEYYLASKCRELYAPPGAYLSLLGLKVQATFLGGVLEKAGIEPQVQAIGKYKSAGDQIARKNMSEPNREMLSALLDDIYDHWVDGIAAARGKTRKEVEELLNAGIFELPKLKEAGWITDIKYEDEIDDMLKQKLGLKEDKRLPTVDYKRYSKVKEWTLGLSGGGEKIAVIRAVGAISRARGGILGASTEGIVSDSFIEKIRRVRDTKEFKAVVLRIDSPGGDALASDLMWREIKLLASKKPVVASMADVAASGGYYMAMAAGVIVAESLTLTGSIGVVTGKFNLGELYERIGYTKEIISRGRFAELDAEQRPFSQEEKEYFARSAQSAYKSFRDKAALSRSMEVEQMEGVAQGRVWTGKAALDRGLVDAVGGFWRAVAIAKQKAGIASDKKVALVELSQQQTSLLGVLQGGASLFIPLMKLAESEHGRTLLSFILKQTNVADDLPSSTAQARMNDISIDPSGWGRSNRDSLL